MPDCLGWFWILQGQNLNKQKDHPFILSMISTYHPAKHNFNFSAELDHVSIWMNQSIKSGHLLFRWRQRKKNLWFNRKCLVLPHIVTTLLLTHIKAIKMAPLDFVDILLSVIIIHVSFMTTNSTFLHTTKAKKGHIIDRTVNCVTNSGNLFLHADIFRPVLRRTRCYRPCAKASAGPTQLVDSLLVATHGMDIPRFLRFIYLLHLCFRKSTELHFKDIKTQIYIFQQKKLHAYI
jgi:hypothetical protein